MIKILNYLAEMEFVKNVVDTNSVIGSVFDKLSYIGIPANAQIVRCCLNDRYTEIPKYLKSYIIQYWLKP